jgi:hypothetical protein
MREQRGQGLPRIGSVANAESCGDRTRQSALFQIIDRARSVLQLRPVELGGVEHQRRQILRQSAALGVTGALFMRHLDSRLPGQVLDGVGKRFTAVLHEKPIAVPCAPQPKQ